MVICVYLGGVFSVGAEVVKGGVFLFLKIATFHVSHYVVGYMQDTVKGGLNRRSVKGGWQAFVSRGFSYQFFFYYTLFLDKKLYITFFVEIYYFFQNYILLFF